MGRLASSGEHELTVYAPKWKGAEAYDGAAEAAGYRVVRHPTTLMLPEPSVEARMRHLIGRHDIETVWFGAAAPLALLAGRARRAGAGRVLASTHGHEVGWSMLPGARSALRRIGEGADVITYVSSYTRGRFASAFGSHAAMEHLPPGVDTDRFRPDPGARAELRRRYGLGERPTVVCVSRLVPRKGQDMLIRALPRIRERVDGAALVIVGGGPYLPTLRKLAADHDVADHVVFTAGCPPTSWPPTTCSATCSRCRAAPAAPAWTSRAGHRLPRGVGQRSAGGRRFLGRRPGDGGRGQHRDGGRRPPRR